MFSRNRSCSCTTQSTETARNSPIVGNQDRSVDCSKLSKLDKVGNFDVGNIRQEIKMPKDKEKKEKKSSKVVETVEDVEMKDSSPKVCLGAESS